MGRAAAACIALVLPAAPGLAAEDLSQWAHSSDVFLNTLPDGANVTGTVRNFPVLIRLDGNHFDFSQALAGGKDIRFADPAGAPLHYQIERWDAAASVAEIWVKLDSVAGNSKDQSFKMYWGNPAAANGSNGAAVFDSADGFSAVWHLGGSGTAARANSVAGGRPAATNNYDGDESRPGAVGLCDSLDGSATGDYLDIGDGYADFSRGFTYSVWTNPSAAGNYAKLLDIGNGTGIDNITLFRVATSTDLAFKTWHGADTSKRVVAAGALALNQWQLIALTVKGKRVEIYRNGALIKSDSIAITLSDTTRLLNYLGRSNWASNAYYAGKLDEPWISHAARSADWLRLCYANQKPNQAFVSFARPTVCTERFSVPKDTAVTEGSRLELNAVADCASGYSWDIVSGSGLSILDPDNKVLQVYLPRVTADTAFVFRFTAQFDSARHKDVRVAVKNSIPDPVFTLPKGTVWNGRDTVAFRPDIANLAQIRASRDSALTWLWSLSGVPVDTTVLADGLGLLSCGVQGNLDVTLCLTNGGEWACKAAIVTVKTAAGLGLPPASPAAARPPQAWSDALGRWLPARGGLAGRGRWRTPLK